MCWCWGSLPSGGRGQVLMGSTADGLLHASPVPVAISPRKYPSHNGKLTRLTCAYSATPDAIDVVKRFDFGQRFGVPVRVITFAVRGKTMYPPEVGLEVEDQVLQAWASQVRDILQELKTDGIVSEDVALQVVTGRSWKEALGKVDWQEGEIGIGHAPARRHPPGLHRFPQHQDHPGEPGAGGAGAARLALGGGVGGRPRPFQRGRDIASAEEHFVEVRLQRVVPGREAGRRPARGCAGRRARRRTA